VLKRRYVLRPKSTEMPSGSLLTVFLIGVLRF